MIKVLSLATVGAVLLVAGCAGPRATTAPPTYSAPATGAARSSGPSSPAGPASARPSGDAASDGPKNVPATLRFHGTKVDGGDFDGASLVGKPVLLWFWAPRCPLCRRQIDQVQRIAQDNEGKANVVGVGSLDDAKAISRFAADAPGMTHLNDESGAVWRHFQVAQPSSFVLLDAKGTKVYSVGYGGSKGLGKRVAAVTR
jgi:thiol-disulfide isomerase/thioredoxin